MVDDVDVLVVAFTGDDGPGLVHALAEVISDHGGSWESSHMVSWHGVFAGTLVVTAEADRCEALAEDLRALDGMLQIHVRAATRTPVREGVRSLRLDVVGRDHPGIVEEFTAAIARPRVNVRCLDSRSTQMPGGGQEFRVHAHLEVGGGTDLHAWFDGLHDLARRLDVELTLTPAGE